MSKKCSRIICMLLALVMVLGFMPVLQVSAAGSTETVEKHTYIGEVDGNKAYLVSQVEVEVEEEPQASDDENQVYVDEAEVRAKTVNAIGTDKYGDTTFTTFADLKKLVSGTYTEYIVAVYAGSASEFVISENITIPDYLDIYFWDIPVTIKSGVTVTSNGYLNFDKLTVNGTLVNNSGLYVSTNLTVKGQIKSESMISLESGITITGKDKIAFTSDWAGFHINCYASTEAEVYSILKNAANDKSGDQYSCYVEGAVTLKSNCTIPGNVELAPQGKLTINGTCTVEGSIWAYEAPITVNGKLVNKGSVYLYNTTLTMSSGASYSGTGNLVCYDLAPEKAIKGLNLSQFDIEDQGYAYVLTYAGNKTRLDKPTNLGIDEFGYLYWTNGKNVEELVRIIIYCNGKEVQNSLYWAPDANTKYLCETFVNGEWESGTYYFEVYAVAESGNYRNSEIAKSATWTYKKPTSKLGTCTNVKLDGTILTWKAPSNVTNLEYYQVNLYCYETANAQYPVYSGWVWVEKSVTSIDIKEFLEYWGDGYYEIDIQAKSTNINKTQNGDVSARTKRVLLEQNAPPRLAGSNRHITALLIAEQLKEVMGVNKFDAVIVAAGYNFADALAGSYLSNVKKAPILLSYGGGGKYAYLDTDNIDYIKSNLKSGGTVYLLGGENAVPALYEKQLSGYNVKRLGGKDRFETNLLILKEAGVKAGQEILVCTATEYADALSASATGLPILLVFNQKGALYGGQPDYLKSLGGKNSFCIIGGTGAVGTKLETALKQYGKVTRLAGTDRLDTSVKVAEKYFPNATSAVVAYGWNYPDGLCGGSLAYAMKAPLLLTYSAPKYYAIAADYTARQGITSGVILGGESLVTREAANAIF